MQTTHIYPYRGARTTIPSNNGSPSLFARLIITDNQSIVDKSGERNANAKALLGASDGFLLTVFG
jgi:hypothetical protein